MSAATSREGEHEQVFGKTFALYNRDEILEFTRFFDERFKANKLDPRALFSGKSVLDAGCGNGRGSIFALTNGAAWVDAIDFSETNTKTTAKNLSSLQLGPIEVRQGTLEALPYPAAAFDVVWCNGVIMHTANPDRCLCEIARVLRPGGSAWIYVYGSGGIYWRFVQTFRAIMKDIPAERIIALLQLMRYETRFVAEYLDDWKAGHLRTYTNADFSTRLIELGFANVTPLPFGVSYDTSHRINMFPSDAKWFGEGDLRYLVAKTGNGVNTAPAISANEQGSSYQFPPEIDDRFAQHLERLKEACAGKPAIAVAACAYVQWNLRNIMAQPGPLAVEQIEHLLNAGVTLATGH